jgi:hypothetical protein
MVKVEEVKDRIRQYLQIKNNLDISSCYAICKDLTDEYWDEWRSIDETQEEEKEDFSDFELPVNNLPISSGPVSEAIKEQQANPILPDVKMQDLPIRVV